MELKSNMNDVKQLSVADEIVEFVISLSERSQKISSYLDEKLTPVMIKAEESELDEKIKDFPDREYPPLFYKIQENLFIIDNYLNKIECALSRTEL